KATRSPSSRLGQVSSWFVVAVTGLLAPHSLVAIRRLRAATMDADGQDDERRREPSQVLQEPKGGNMERQISRVVRRLRVGKQVGVAAALFGLLGIVPYLARTQEQNEIEEGRQQSPLIPATTPPPNP